MAPSPEFEYREVPLASPKRSSPVPPDEEDPDRPFGPPANDEAKGLAVEILKELLQAFRDRQKSGGGGSSPGTVAVERIKLLANFFNTVAAGLLTAGVIGPMAAYLYGFSATSRPLSDMAQGVLVLLTLSVILHLMGRAVLGRLSP